jgi:transposase InsO family protein
VAARQLIPPADPLSGQAIGRRRLSRGVESSEAPLRRTDVTEHPTAEGEVHLCAIKDLHSGRIVGCSMGARMTAAPAVTALHDAIALRSPAGTIVHSDRGSQLRRSRGGTRRRSRWCSEVRWLRIRTSIGSWNGHRPPRTRS